MGDDTARRRRRRRQPILDVLETRGLLSGLVGGSGQPTPVLEVPVARLLGPAAVATTAGDAPDPTDFAERLVSMLVHNGDTVVAASSDDPNLSVYAIQDANGHVDLLVFNPSASSALTGQFQVANFQPEAQAQVWQIEKAQDTAQSQTTDGTVALTNFSTTLSLNGSSFRDSFPAYSMTVLDLSAASPGNESDNRLADTSVEPADPTTRQGPTVGVFKDDAAELPATGDQSGSLPGRSDAIALSSSLSTTDVHSPTAGLVSNQPIGTTSDGETPGGPLGRLVNSPAAGLSTSTGVGRLGAHGEEGRSSSVQPGEGLPNTVARSSATAPEPRADREAPSASPRGDGLIAQFTQLGYSAVEEAFNHWFARIEQGDALDGASATRTTRLWPLSLTTVAVVAGLRLARRLRRSHEARALGRRVEGRPGSFLEFPVAWSPRIQ